MVPRIAGCAVKNKIGALTKDRPLRGQRTKFGRQFLLKLRTDCSSEKKSSLRFGIVQTRMPPYKAFLSYESVVEAW